MAERKLRHYQMPDRVGHRLTARPVRNAFVQHCMDNRRFGVLGPWVEDALNEYLRREREEDLRHQTWAKVALDELDRYGEIRTLHAFDRTTARTGKSQTDMTTIALALTEVYFSPWKGVASRTIERKHRSYGGSIGGALSKLHRAGIIACLRVKS